MHSLASGHVADRSGGRLGPKAAKDRKKRQSIKDEHVKPVECTVNACRLTGLGVELCLVCSTAAVGGWFSVVSF